MLTRTPQLLQQHINRSVKRIARMQGRAPPTKRNMAEKIAKRLFIPAAGRPNFTANANEKRYNRQGAKDKDPALQKEGRRGRGRRKGEYKARGYITLHGR